jgi:hypothetical protein
MNSFSVTLCNMPHKIEHAGIAHCKPLDYLSHLNSQVTSIIISTRYSLAVTPVDQAGAAVLYYSSVT